MCTARTFYANDSCEPNLAEVYVEPCQQFQREPEGKRNRQEIEAREDNSRHVDKQQISSNFKKNLKMKWHEMALKSRKKREVERLAEVCMLNWDFHDDRGDSEDSVETLTGKLHEGIVGKLSVKKAYCWTTKDG